MLYLVTFSKFQAKPFIQYTAVECPLSVIHSKYDHIIYPSTCNAN